MKTAYDEALAPYVARLEEIPFVHRVRLAPLEPRQDRDHWDARLEIRAAGVTHRFLVEHKRTVRLNYALVDALLGRVQRERPERWVLFTPHITPPMADYLRKRGVNYVDAAGNCHLAIDRGHVAIFDGRRPARHVEDARIVGPRGYQVLFALLANPELVGEPVRRVAKQAGVGKTIAAVTLKRLEGEGLVIRTATTTHLAKPAALLDRWFTGYLEILRPKLLIGHFHAEEKDPLVLERRLEKALTGAADVARAARETAGRKFHWAWGGAAAAYRLTRHYRGEETVLHLEGEPHELARRLLLLPARTGPVMLLRVPGPLAFEGALPHTAHPLLVYTELLAAGDERARAAAAEVRDRFLPKLG